MVKDKPARRRENRIGEIWSNWMLMREMDDGEDEEDLQESVIVKSVDAYDDVKAEDYCSERRNQLGRKPADEQVQSPAMNKNSLVQGQYKSR
ncbi:hypothetical protein F511_27881 [Dorcoceras hygrometricum]|uniref:Uncharacterized protein n=1 Tax=Dorcoceras hygrometricum TaxID=472368 RepID=A0A2Z7BPE1_9LAMI|nr:hypothetical protein F511_27881 [Dorcoceras hygrometricum]